MVDSVQTIGAASVDGVPGGVTQVKEVAAALIRVAKTRNITTMLVGHVTKDGSIAGPRVLEHLVDVVLHFEGDRNSRFRMVRALKNRFGPVDEVGCFDLGADGITAVTDPTGLFVDRHHEPVAGTCVAVTMEGRRPMLAEVQALVTQARRATPTYHVRARLLAGGDDPGGPPEHCGRPARHARRLRLHRRRRPAGSPRATSRSRSRSRRPPGAPRAAGVAAIGEISLAGEVRRVRTSRSASPRRAARLPPRRRPRRAGRRSPQVDGLEILPGADLRPPCASSTSSAATRAPLLAGLDGLAGHNRVTPSPRPTSPAPPRDRTLGFALTAPCSSGTA